MLGGMETLETSKPDLVFDGELDFEKGVMFTRECMCIFILVHWHVCICNSLFHKLFLLYIVIPMTWVFNHRKK